MGGSRPIRKVINRNLHHGGLGEPPPPTDEIGEKENTMEFQEALKNRVHEIINKEASKVDDDKWHICQTGIKVDENGNFALIIARQMKRNYLVVENLYTVAL